MARVPTRRLPAWFARDADHFLLFAGLAAIVAVTATLFPGVVDGRVAGLVIGGYLLTEIAASIARSRWSWASARRVDLARMVASVVFVAVIADSAHDQAGLPLIALYVPVVVMAAVTATRDAIVVGVVALGLLFAPDVAAGRIETLTGVRSVALTGITILLVIGTRRTVDALRGAHRRMRTAVSDAHRQRRIAASIGEASDILARRGPDQEALDQVMAFAADGLRYRFVSLYLAEDGGLRLAAQRGYATPIERFDGTSGVMGRVLRTARTAFVPDVRADRDYRSASDEVASEISVPLVEGGQVLGIFNLEATASRPLETHDVRIAEAVANRLATAFALARERERIDTRARLMRDLVEFSAVVSRTLEPEPIFRAIVDTAQRVVPADLVALTVLEADSGRFVVRAARGVPAEVVGSVVRPGEGMAGRAIRDLEPVIIEQFDRADYPAEVRTQPDPDRYSIALGMPLVRDGVAIGALTIAREQRRSFDPLELEGMELLASQAALVVANVASFAEATTQASSDFLTGLRNRRWFDAELDRQLAALARMPADRRLQMSAILFDLDYFGALNKDHGHQVGDRVLRAFAGILRQRIRATDLLARYGGEEFVAVLIGAGKAEAASVADEIRAALAREVVEVDGGSVRVTVSAGVAELDPAGDGALALLARADVGLAMAKRSGRDRVVAA